MASRGRVFEHLIQTATALLAGRLAPREAVTILATQAPLARAMALGMARSDPDHAGAYAAVIESLAVELRAGMGESKDPGQLRAALSELDRVVLALRPSSG